MFGVILVVAAVVMLYADFDMIYHRGTVVTVLIWLPENIGVEGNHAHTSPPLEEKVV